jgi:nucleoside-diphosphate-sugar epimerase
VTQARFTVLGGAGYLGSHLVPALRQTGASVAVFGRDDDLFSGDLGHVIYSIAVTNDARDRANDAVRANVSLLLEVLGRARFESLLYLSSAQVYFGADRSVEDAEVRIDPGDPGDVYRASKVMGEMLCLSSPRPTVRVARLSAVYGDRLSPRSFLAGVVREAVERRAVELRTTLDSERDFVHVDDVTRVLPEIALRGRARIYNVASGRSTTNGAVVSALEAATGCTTKVAVGAPRSAYPRVDVSRIHDELGFVPSADVVSRIPAIVRAYASAGPRGPS